jgi:uncharacterized protein
MGTNSTSTFQPFYSAVAAYTPNSSQELTPGFVASFAFYALFMGLLSFIFLICSLRTNLIFVLIFTAACLGFLLAAGAFWATAAGMAIGATLLVATGGAFFAAAMLGWYLLAVIMFVEMDLGIPLPVFDLSTTIKGASEREAAKKQA